MFFLSDSDQNHYEAETKSRLFSSISSTENRLTNGQKIFVTVQGLKIQKYNTGFIYRAFACPLLNPHITHMCATTETSAG